MDRTQNGSGSHAANDEALVHRLSELENEHRDLDSAIVALEGTRNGNFLAIQRLKKRKLRLKDEIERLRDTVNPDIIA